MRPINYDHVPACTYCDPEIGSVGLTEAEAKERGYDVRIGTFPFRVLGRARMANETDGFVKIVAEKKYDEVLGVHMIGPRSTELVAEATLALRLECTVEELIRTIHAHPTMSEAGARSGARGCTARCIAHVEADADQIRATCELYYFARLTRDVEERLAILYRQNKVVGGLYRSLGQEGESVASAYTLRGRDVTAPLIRNLGALHHPRRAAARHLRAVHGEGHVADRRARSQRPLLAHAAGGRGRADHHRPDQHAGRSDSGAGAASASRRGCAASRSSR